MHWRRQSRLFHNLPSLLHYWICIQLWNMPIQVIVYKSGWMQELWLHGNEISFSAYHLFTERMFTTVYHKNSWIYRSIYLIAFSVFISWQSKSNWIVYLVTILAVGVWIFTSMLLLNQALNLMLVSFTYHGNF